MLLCCCFCVVPDWFVAVDIAGAAGVCGFDLSGGLAVRGFGRCLVCGFSCVVCFGLICVASVFGC